MIEDRFWYWHHKLGYLFGLIFERRYKRIKLIFCSDTDSDNIGLSWRSSNTIELNITHITEDNLDEVIVHELCHLIAPEEENDHGEEWQRCMKLAGFKPKEII